MLRLLENEWRPLKQLSRSTRLHHQISLRLPKNFGTPELVQTKLLTTSNFLTRKLRAMPIIKGFRRTVTIPAVVQLLLKGYPKTAGSPIISKEKRTIRLCRGKNERLGLERSTKLLGVY